MSDCMTFPDTVEEFMEQYKVVDTEGIYMSKGSELVPIFRMKQWFEHKPERKKGKWDFMGWQMFQCSECKHTFTQDFLEGWREYTYEPFFPPFCPNCGADMRGKQDDSV